MGSRISGCRLPGLNLPAGAGLGSPSVRLFLPVSVRSPQYPWIPVNLSILIPQAFQKCSFMDVNSNSHAEPSRADSHVKDTRSGATVPPKEKKVTWQLHICHTVGSPSFLALTLTRLLYSTFVPSVFFLSLFFF